MQPDYVWIAEYNFFRHREQKKYHVDELCDRLMSGRPAAVPNAIAMVKAHAAIEHLREVCNCGAVYSFPSGCEGAPMFEKMESTLTQTSSPAMAASNIHEGFAGDCEVEEAKARVFSK